MRTVISFLLLSLASADSGLQTRKVIYNRIVTPPSWHLVSRASSYQKMSVLVAVKQQNLAELEKKFWAVSDPKSPEWQNFMSAEEIGTLVASSKTDITTVMDWVKATVSKKAFVTQTADAVQIQGTVADVENLFQAQVFSFVHDNGHTILRVMGEHSIPSEVHAAMDFVEGVSEFPMHRASSRKIRKPVGNKPLEQPAVSAMVCPESLLGLYSVPADAKISTVSQGPAEFQDDTSYNKQDLQTFFKQTDLADEKVTDTVGPYDGSQPDTEATLDVQYITSIGQKQTNWYWTSQSWMYTFAHNFFNHATVPDAVSISWGWAEDGQCTAGIDQKECQTLGINSEQLWHALTLSSRRSASAVSRSLLQVATLAPTGGLTEHARTRCSMPPSQDLLRT